MRIDFVYVDNGLGNKIAVNPDAVEYIYVDNSSIGGGCAIIALRSGRELATGISVETAIKLFSPMNIAGGR